jgi:PAS domain S-box-containing protein
MQSNRFAPISRLLPPAAILVLTAVGTLAQLGGPAGAAAALKGLAPWITAALGITAAWFVFAGTSHRRAAGAASKSGVPLPGDAQRLEAIMRSAMDAIITIDAQQRVVLFNAAAERMFGIAAGEAIGGPLERFIPARLRAAHVAHVDRFARTGDTSRRMGLQMSLAAQRADGTEFPIEASISQATVDGQRLLTVILRDVSERVQAGARLERAHAALHEGEARLEAIVRSAMDAIITVDAGSRVVLFNGAAERLFGVAAPDAVGSPLDRFIPPRFRGAHAGHIERFVRTGETSRRMGMQTALWALHADGSEFPIEASISHATVGGQKLLTVILRDITERVAAERKIRQAGEELRSLSVAMLEVREAERTRIARELHDELGQALTALKMDVDLMAATLPDGRDDLQERIRAMREMLDFTVATTRRISADLRPLVLDDLGLGAAAEWLAHNVVQRAGVACDLHIDPSCADLGEPHASALFRIMQESLTNVTRHAHARRVEVALERAGDDAVLTVRDDGVGIEPGSRPKPTSFGLRGIRERVLLLGGDVRISSAAGAGTTVVARIPLAETPAAPAS